MYNKDNIKNLHNMSMMEEYCMGMARYFGMSQIEKDNLALSCRMHDIGKRRISDDILFKPGKLTDEEFDEMKKHTLFGYLTLKTCITAKEPAEVALYHHEKWNGTGYPHSLKGEDIPLSARIVTVADVYDALTSNRPYKKAWSHKESLKEICDNSGILYDPRVVEAFVALESRFNTLTPKYSR